MSETVGRKYGVVVGGMAVSGEDTESGAIEIVYGARWRGQLMVLEPVGSRWAVGGVVFDLEPRGLFEGFEAVTVFHTDDLAKAEALSRIALDPFRTGWFGWDGQAWQELLGEEIDEYVPGTMVWIEDGLPAVSGKQ